MSKMTIKVHERIEHTPEEIQYFKDVCNHVSRSFSQERVRENFPFLIIDQGQFPPGKDTLDDGEYCAVLRLRKNPTTIQVQCCGGNAISAYSTIHQFSPDSRPIETANAITAWIKAELPKLWKSFDHYYNEAIKDMFRGLYTHFYDKYLDVIDQLKKEYKTPRQIRATIDKLIDRDSD